MTPIRRGWRDAVRKELRDSRSVWITIAGFALIGPFLTRMIFPEASLALIVFGGVALGIVFGMCALAGRILE
ncbi:MAG: hypothetical protein DCC71_01135 [Proteobacteria bacterium]|nr:MAG: hypothetical protein DCC71_01135 [Pseudomonadota bacterium]